MQQALGLRGGLPCIRWGLYSLLAAGMVAKHAPAQFVDQAAVLQHFAFRVGTCKLFTLGPYFMQNSWFGEGWTNLKPV